MGQTIDVSGDYYLDFSNPEAFEEYYRENIEHHTLLGNGNGRITKVNEEIVKLKEEIKNLRTSKEHYEAKNIENENRLNIIEEMLKDHGLIKVEVDPETYEKYKIIAKAQGISISEVIRNLTDKNLDKL